MGFKVLIALGPSSPLCVDIANSVTTSRVRVKFELELDSLSRYF